MEARCFLIEAAARLPNLALLDIRASFSVIHVQNALLSLLSGARQLKKVILPRYWLTSAVVSALALSPRLEVLQWEYTGQGHGDSKNVQTFQVSAGDGSFPSLVDLSLEVNLQDAIEFIESSSFPRQLTTFYIRSLCLAPPADIQHFFTQCSTVSRSLTHLYLDLHTNSVEAVSESHYLTLGTLRPVLSCPNVTHFMITHNAPLSISDGDVEFLASRWTSLVSLYLNDEPLWLETPKLTLAALLSFAEHCPRLEELGLYVDATAPPPSLLDPIPFTQLRTLDFGISPIEDECGTVALFLSRICPFTAAAKRLEIMAGISWDPVLQKTIDPVVGQEVLHRRAAWNSVGKYIPMLLALRAEERSRMSTLEDELKGFRRLGVEEGQQRLPSGSSVDAVQTTAPADLRIPN